jgi:hypothetical protein
MVYNTQNYWVSGLCQSSGILNTRKHNVPETGSVSVLRWGETPTRLDPLERANLDPSHADGNRVSFRNVMFSSYLERSPVTQ